MLVNRTRATRRTALFGLGANAVIGLSAPAVAQQGKLRTLRFLGLPIAGNAGVHIADSHGFFREEGVKAEFIPGRTPADGIAMAMGGQLDVTNINVGGLAAAAAQNLPLKVLATCYIGTDDFGIYVRKDSPIKSVKDLSGKNIALIQLRNNVHGLVLDTLERDGVSPSSVDFSLVPVANTLSSLIAGNVEAAMIIEPFIALAGDSIRPIISNVFGSFGGRGVAAYWVTSAHFKAENAELAAGLKRSIDRASVFAQQNPDAIRTEISTMINIDPAALQRMKLPQFSPDMSLDNAEAQVQIMTKYGFFPTKPDLKPYFN